MNAHPLPRSQRPLANPLIARRGVTTLIAAGSAIILMALTAATSPVFAAAATTGSEPGKSHKSAEAAKPRTGEAAKRKPRHPSVGQAANPAPMLSPPSTLGDPNAAATSSAFEHGPGVLGMSLRTLRQQQIKEYVTEPVAMVALALDDLRFAPVNKGTHIEVNLADRIAFDGKGDKVSPKSRRLLDVLARILTDNPQTRAEVLVHTDDSGDAHANRMQSQRSADAVKAYLMGKGVADTRITAVGRGGDAPLIVAGKRTPTRQARSNRNRRVELVVAPLVAVPTTPTQGPVGEMKPPTAPP